MFEHDTCEDIAEKTYRELIEYMRRNPALCVPLGLEGNRITLEAPSGARLTITCLGPEHFTLEQGKFPVGGFRAEPRRSAGNERMSLVNVERCIREWLRNPIA